MVAVGLNSNIASVVAQRYLNGSSRALGDSFLRLSTGQRINKASDDAAGLAIASSLNARARIYSQAMRNTNDAISALAIAEGGLSQLGSIVGRLNELAIGAANGSLSLTQRRTSDTEAYQLVQEFNRIVEGTTFNGRTLIDGTLGELGIQVGIGNNEIIGVALGNKLSRNSGTGIYTDSGATGLTGSTSNSRMATADFNGDGRLDFVKASASAGAVVVELNDGAGGFIESSLSLSGGGFPFVTDVLAGDFNGDGKMDVAAGNSINGVQVFYGNGSGGFSAATVLSAGVPSQSLVAGDFNGDGRTDLAFAIGTTVTVHTQTSSGGFSSGASYASGLTAVASITAGDFNGDGNLDIVAFHSLHGGSFLRGSTTGALASSSTFSIAGASGTITSGDIDHDGVLDLVATGSNSVKVVRGTGNGTFGSVSSYSVTGIGSLVNLFDMNGDGNLDIMGGGASGGAFVAVLLNSGTGTFGSASTKSVANLFNGVCTVAGDFNGDGVADIAYSDFEDVGVVGTLLQGTTRYSTIARVDLTTRSAALATIDSLSSIFQRIQNEIGSIGSFQSRLATALSAIGARGENYLAAAGRITNADIASESSELLRRQILQQSASAVLAQANQQPALALSLLR